MFRTSKYLITPSLKLELSKLVNFSSNLERINPIEEQFKSDCKSTPQTSNLFQFYSNSIIDDIHKNMIIYQDFLNIEEENKLISELEPYLKRMRYEYDHWDDAIHGYRETEKLNWNEENKKIIQKVKKLAFPDETSTLQHIHVLDLTKEGYIKPHIDSVRFCGNIITGLSLLSTSVMRLIHEKKPEFKVDILLPQRSLYIMKNIARFDYTHEILADKDSWHQGKHIPRDRRISIMCRSEPTNNDN